MGLGVRFARGSRTWVVDMTSPDPQEVEYCARTAHEVCRAFCIALGDHSQLSWEEAREWQKDAARDGARAALLNPETTPEQSHSLWCQKKYSQGWVYGPEKDEILKLHPCLVEYAQLPGEQRAKDDLFLAAVRGTSARFQKRGRNPRAAFELALVDLCDNAVLNNQDSVSIHDIWKLFAKVNP